MKPRSNFIRGNYVYGIAYAICMSIVSIILVSFLMAGTGKKIGHIGRANGESGEVIVNLESKAGSIQMGQKLVVTAGDREIVLKAVNPMVRVVKCRAASKDRKYLSGLKKGAPVYLYVKGSPVKREPKTGTVKTIGGIEFVYIRGGTYMMGSKKSDDDANDAEFPRHRVTMSGFWLGKYEVTQSHYVRIMGENPSNFKGSRRPVDGVSWYDAIQFCNKLSEKMNLEPVYEISKPFLGIFGGYSVKINEKANGFRLPYEAEWEYACRAGTTTKYYWGNSINGRYCWYDDNSGSKTHPVGQKKPNRWGLYDMSGNVWEWCMDWYDSDYYSNSQQKNPHGPSSGKYRSIRGGSYYNHHIYNVRSASRYRCDPGYSDGTLGFRVVLSSR